MCVGKQISLSLKQIHAHTHTHTQKHSLFSLSDSWPRLSLSPSLGGESCCHGNCWEMHLSPQSFTHCRFYSCSRFILHSLSHTHTHTHTHTPFNTHSEASLLTTNRNQNNPTNSDPSNSPWVCCISQNKH